MSEFLIEDRGGGLGHRPTAERGQPDRQVVRPDGPGAIEVGARGSVSQRIRGAHVAQEHRKVVGAHAGYAIEIECHDAGIGELHAVYKDVRTQGPNDVGVRQDALPPMSTISARP